MWVLQVYLNTKVTEAVNGGSFNILFIIPDLIPSQVDWFVIYSMVSEIHDNVDMRLGIKNIIESKAEISTRE